jgi:hypothetical protein
VSPRQVGEQAHSAGLGERDELSRRTFLTRAGMVGAAAALAQLPPFLEGKGWLGSALAAETDMTRDTVNGLVAFVVPGPDPYSKAQGQSSKTPGGIAAKTTDAFIELLDRYVGTSEGPNVPSSAAVAALLNGYALQVNPAAAGGGFVSPFARLKFAEKIEVFRRFEHDTEGQQLRSTSGILIGAVGFLSHTEWGAYDFERRRLTSVPVGWKTSNYEGVREGRAELKGYYQGRRKVSTSPRYRV